MWWKIRARRAGPYYRNDGSGVMPGRDDVRAWHAHVDQVFADPAVVDQGRSTLNDADRERFDRYHAERDRRMFLLGRLMSRRLVGEALGVPPEQWQWRDGHARPARNRGAADAHPLQPRAQRRPRRLRARECARGRRRRRRPAAPADRRADDSPVSLTTEADDVEAQGEHWSHRFLHYWTLKEAYLKALGLGISVPLREISFALEPEVRITFLGSLAGTSTSWVFQLLQPTDQHLVAIAASADDGIRPDMRIGVFPNRS